MRLSYSLPLPFKSQAKKRRSDALMTLNVYRNLHFQSLNSFKQSYGVLIKEQLPTSRKFDCISIKYILNLKPTAGKPTKADPYRGSKPRNIDLTNVLTMVDKVNQDVLVSSGIIPDDTIRYVQLVSFEVKPFASEDSITVIVEEITPEPDLRKDKYEI